MNLVFEIGPKRLYAFSKVSDQTIFHWPAQQSGNKYLVQFSGMVSHPGSNLRVHCEPLNVTVIIRKDAIPLPNPQNTVVPNNTYLLNNGYLFRGSFILFPAAQNKTTDVRIDANSADVSNFFVSLFLPDDSERFDVSGLSKECHYHSAIKVFVSNTKDKIPLVKRSQHNGIKLFRHQNALFDVHYLPQNYKFNLSTTKNMLFYWSVFSLTDSGGTLDVTLRLFPFVLSTSTFGVVNATVHGCVMTKTALEKQSNSSNCIGTKIQLHSSHKENSLTWHFPFPVSGTWTLNLSLQCTDLIQSNFACAQGFLPGYLNVSIVSCVDDCNYDLKYGSCTVYRSDAVLFSACQCKADRLGIACNDGRNALNYYRQLMRSLILSLSNLFFIPCIALAISEKYYSEALMYSFLCFMSSFHHACDQSQEVFYCLLPHETLQFFDFFCLISAIWITFVAAAELPPPLQSFLYVLGLIVFIVIVSYDRFSVGNIVFALIASVLVVGSKWSFKSHESKKCYPGFQKSLFSIVPAVIFAVAGSSLYAFSETSENYVVHSIWHILFGTAISFLLPRAAKQKLKSKVDLYADYFKQYADHYKRTMMNDLYRKSWYYQPSSAEFSVGIQ